MELEICGMNHRSAPVEVRERLSLSQAKIPEAILELRKRGVLQESLILSTCNRFEIYAVKKEGSAGPDLANFLAELHGLDPSCFKPFLYHFQGRDAVEHLFKVAASLDSMLIGEAQILGQVKEAYRIARETGTAGDTMAKIFTAAFHVGRKIRNQTAIGRGGSSISSASVEFAKKVVGDLKDKTVLLIGAGKMGELAVRHLKGRGAGKVFVANRTVERAKETAEKIEGEAIGFESLFKVMKNVDIVMSSTAAPHMIIYKEDILGVMKDRNDRPLLLIDVAVPRDIDPSTAEITGVHLYNIDDLKEACDRRLSEKLKVALAAEEIVKEQVKDFVCSFGLSSLRMAG